MNFKKQAIIIAILLVLTVSDNPYCSTWINNNTQCTACYFGYYLDASAICTAGNPHCASFTNDGTGNCATCWSSSFAGPACAVVPVTPPAATDPQCATVTSGVCSACYAGYYLNSANKCILGNQNCATLTSPLGLCGSCHSGYVLNSGSTDCVVPAVSSDPYCTTRNGLNVCTACTGGYYLNTLSVCSLANPHCASIATTPSNGECLSCYNGYYLSSSGACLVGDPYCINYTGGVCTSCWSNLHVSSVDPTRCIVWCLISIIIKDNKFIKDETINEFIL